MSSRAGRVFVSEPQGPHGVFPGSVNSLQTMTVSHLTQQNPGPVGDPSCLSRGLGRFQGEAIAVRGAEASIGRLLGWPEMLGAWALALPPSPCPPTCAATGSLSRPPPSILAWSSVQALSPAPGCLPAQAHLCSWVCFFFHLLIYFFKKGFREKERERNINVWLACNPALCPDWESNRRPFCSQGGQHSVH